MTKKDYVKLAEALNKTRPRVYSTDVQWQDDVEAIANVLAADNPAFDKVKFWQACTK